jgi:hypothetical protein
MYFDFMLKLEELPVSNAEKHYFDASPVTLSEGKVMRLESRIRL